MTLSEQIEHTRQEQLLSAVYDSRDRHRAEMEEQTHTMTHDEMIAVIAAHRDGKRILSRHRLHDSKSWGYSEPCWDFNQFDYRVAPEPKRVPLGPEDFPPGTVVRFRSTSLWCLVVANSPRGIAIPSATSHSVEIHYENIMDSMERLLPGTTEWLPCWKEEEA